MDTVVEVAGLDRLADLAARSVGAPSAQVVLLHGELHEVVAAAGAPPGVPSRGPVEAASTVCRLTAAQSSALVVEDAAADPRTAGLPGVVAGLVGSYLGVGLRAGRRTVGVLCVYGPEPRAWTEHDVAALEQLGASAVAELELGRAAEDLHSARLRSALAVDAAGVGGWDYDPATGALRGDDRVLQVFGLAREDFAETLEEVGALVHPDDLQRVSAALREAVRTCGEFEAEFRVVHRDGRGRWVQARGRALPGPGERTARVVGAVYDTTESHDQEARVARVLEAVSAAFYSLDRDFRFRYVNGEAERLLGRPRAQLLGQSLWELFPAERQSALGRLFQAALASGAPAAFEAPHPALQGGLHEVRVWASPEGLSVHFVDITERRRAEARAAAATARLELLLQTTQQLTEVLDARTAVARLAALVVPQLADWSVVTLVEPDGGLRDVGWAHRDPAALPLVERYASRRLHDVDDSAPLLRVVSTGEPEGIPAGAGEVLARVLGDDAARAAAEQLAPEAAWVLPLEARGRTLGVLSLFWGPERGEPTPDDLATAREITARAGSALDNARLYEQQRELAAELQRSMLTAPPEVDLAEVAVRYVPAAALAQVGGDWYDAFLQPDGAPVLVIGDVVGHDTAAAGSMGQLRGLLRGIAFTTGAGPAEVLERLDAAMPGLGLPTTATAAVVRLEQLPDDPAGALVRLRWSTAGHPPPLVLHPDGRVEVLDVDSPDLLLGIDPDVRRQESTALVGRGATVLLHTDGLVERRHRALDDGLDELRRALADLGHLPLEELSDALLRRMLLERPEDDVALVLVRLR